jgi:hypothetical protein
MAEVRIHDDHHIASSAPEPVAYSLAKTSVSSPGYQTYPFVIEARNQFHGSIPAIVVHYEQFKVHTAVAPYTVQALDKKRQVLGLIECGYNY